ncbi:MAG: peptidoglycan DD-metalloendopeptidase family protein [Bacteroidales bacterium]|nr:peptidoglycan DD-metalloendopeptidase family protein [Bacteroidales bacterium]
MTSLRHPQTIVLFFLLSAMVTALFGQEQQALENDRKKIEAEIKYTNRLLEETRKTKQTTLYELRLIATKINRREELISALRKELVVLDHNINSTEDGIDHLNKELLALKEEYARVAFFAFRHKSDYNKLIFLFSASDLNQAYQRLRYLDQIAEFIRKQAALIREKEGVKQKDLEKLKMQKAGKTALLDKQNIQLLKLEQEEAQKKKVESALSGKEKQLRAALRQKEKEARKLRKKIEDIIAREMELKKSKTKNDTYALTPEEKLLSGSFSANKGKLPWPTEKGMVSETFGVHRHPVLKNVKTKNNGLNIVTSKGSRVRTVFSGEVVSIVTITTTNKAVIVKHGEYFSVYANLDEVFVKKGDHLTTKENVGRVHTNTKGKTELHFEIWKGKVLLNPSDWILAR